MNLIRVIQQNRALRITFLLIVIFILAQVSLLAFNRSFKNKLETNLQEIQSAQQQLGRLQMLIGEGAEAEEGALPQKQQLAPYREVVPFISLLEKLFELIDPKAEVTIKDQEEQIFINRYADYQVSLKVGSKKDLFFKALEEMHRAKYPIEITRLNLRYALEGGIESQDIESAEFTVRLFFE